MKFSQNPSGKRVGRWKPSGRKTDFLCIGRCLTSVMVNLSVSGSMQLLLSRLGVAYQ